MSNMNMNVPPVDMGFDPEAYNMYETWYGYPITNQALVVLLSGMIPVVLAAMKWRLVDAFVLLLSALLAVYNMTCLSGPKCTTWAWILAISFAIVTVFEYVVSPMPKPEMMKSKKEKKEERGPKSIDDDEMDEDEMM